MPRWWTHGEVNSIGSKSALTVARDDSIRKYEMKNKLDHYYFWVRVRNYSAAMAILSLGVFVILVIPSLSPRNAAGLFGDLVSKGWFISIGVWIVLLSLISLVVNYVARRKIGEIL